EPLPRRRARGVEQSVDFVRGLHPRRGLAGGTGVDRKRAEAARGAGIRRADAPRDDRAGEFGMIADDSPIKALPGPAAAIVEQQAIAAAARQWLAANAERSPDFAIPRKLAAKRSNVPAI